VRARVQGLRGRTINVFGAQFLSKGHKSAKVKTIYYASSPTESGADSGVTDFCIIEFDEAVSRYFFRGCHYPLAERTMSSSGALDQLLIFRSVKEKTIIDPPEDHRRLLPS
jgi:hypothetical protein